ncbi:unnamed protein product [Caenorhabditis auriculariae]|uniref:Uncharacterized protein n=1 Tax=Caenorhabditis auriculariae TaxID=2777116 RepID=A0A8S1HG77_9PELO|nr:unnamed protein product [Caenorhabditis auriculariae]
MGLLASKLWKYLFPNLECRTLMLGLDGAGKTTILYKLKLNEVVTTIPTIGFNVENVSYQKISMTVWDVGGQERIRALWKYYFPNTTALIFVVDSNDTERVEEAREELWNLLKDPELQNIVLLVFANKQDLPRAMTIPQITEGLELQKITGRQWIVIGSNGLTGDGLYKGLEWLSEKLKEKK